MKESKTNTMKILYGQCVVKIIKISYQVFLQEENWAFRTKWTEKSF